MHLIQENVIGSLPQLCIFKQWNYYSIIYYCYQWLCKNKLEVVLIMVITAQEGNSQFLTICQFCASKKLFSFVFSFIILKGRPLQKEGPGMFTQGPLCQYRRYFIGKIVKTESPHRPFVPQLLEQDVVANCLCPDSESTLCLDCE